MRTRPDCQRAVTMLLVGLGLAIVLTAQAVADDARRKNGFALLSMNGQHLKWGQEGIGRPAAVRYAFVESATSRNGARNCRDMAAFPAQFGSDNISFRELAAEIRAAFSAWAVSAQLHFVETDDPDAADILLGTQVTPSGIAYADVTRGAELHTGVAAIRRAAICFNPELPWETAFDGDSETYDIRYVATHEIGHVLGLDHMRSRDSTIMSFKYREIHRTPQPGDIAGVQYLYGPAPVLAAIGTAGDVALPTACGDREPAGSAQQKTAGHDVPPPPVQTNNGLVATGCAYVSAGSMSSHRTSADP